jgi:hypothetical protein
MDSGNEAAFSDWGMWLYNHGTEGEKSVIEARDVLSRAFDAGNKAVLNNYAWLLCTTRHASVFDARRGMDVTRAMGPLDSLTPAELDTAAACYAAAGDFKQAVALQERAAQAMAALEAPAPSAPAAAAPPAAGQAGTTASAGTAAKPPGYERRLALYRAGKRYEQLDPADD